MQKDVPFGQCAVSAGPPACNPSQIQSSVCPLLLPASSRLPLRLLRKAQHCSELALISHLFCCRDFAPRCIESAGTLACVTTYSARLCSRGQRESPLACLLDVHKAHGLLCLPLGSESNPEGTHQMTEEKKIKEKRKHTNGKKKLIDKQIIT